MTQAQENAGRLAVDFGTSNTVVACWDACRNEGRTLELAEFARAHRQGEETVWVVPSVIHYAEGGVRWIGNQVLERDLYDSPRTFRWMKCYIARRTPGAKTLNGKRITYAQAGRDFLTALLLFASQDLCSCEDEEVILTVPVEAFEDYENWLAEVAEQAGKRHFRLIDEATCAALGYGIHLQRGDAYLVFDFGGGSLDVSVVVVESEQTAPRRRCRVVGKAGAELGGATIDTWLYRELLRSCGLSDLEVTGKAGLALLRRCEEAKELLSSRKEVKITCESRKPPLGVEKTLRREAFEELLEQNEFFTDLDRTLRRALADAAERGYQEEALKAVLAVGGSSQIPSVRACLRRIFGKDRVHMDRPLDAVARGACAFAAGSEICDFIQHDYALRYVDRSRETYRYWPIVKRGTAYPTSEPVARLTVKAAFEGQRELGLVVFELSEDRRWGKGRFIEIAFDASGSARLSTVGGEEKEKRRYCQIGSPTFLVADPPAHRGEGRFLVLFGIDSNKRLTVSAQDRRTGRWLCKDRPLVKLT